MQRRDTPSGCIEFSGAGFQRLLAARSARVVAGWLRGTQSTTPPRRAPTSVIADLPAGPLSPASAAWPSIPALTRARLALRTLASNHALRSLAALL